MVEKHVNGKLENRAFGWMGVVVVVYVNVKAFNLGLSLVNIYDRYKYFKLCFSFCYHNIAGR